MGLRRWALEEKTATQQQSAARKQHEECLEIVHRKLQQNVHVGRVKIHTWAPPGDERVGMKEEQFYATTGSGPSQNKSISRILDGRDENKWKRLNFHKNW
eukprot:TRINITY_DN19048_c1_g1_i1.p1 TRINITY_DN19048_c1_g1~~TRINITY_DN19048_c1_g1_i1.p1  ORF type:complete len:100 (+),score=24.79 TRINITY_DN19048_c1_g1_i1:72-371(+)